MPDREHRFRPTEAADRAHRLSDPGHRAANRRACAPRVSANGATGAPPRRTSPTPPRSCRSAPRSNWSKQDMEAVAAALAELSRRYRDTPMAGRSNLQQAVPLTFGFKTATLLAAMQRHRERLAQLRPRVLVGEFGGAVGTLASLGRRRTQGAGRADAGARPRPAGDRLAHGARPHRRGRLLSRAPHRHARQDFHGREASDADRGGRGLRALPRGARIVEHHAAEAQSDLVPLYPLDRRAGAPARRRAARSRGRRPRALDRSVGDRMDLAA